MCTPQAAKPDPRLAGFVAPKRNMINPFTSQLTRYTDMESDQAYYTRDNKAYQDWKKDPANAGKNARDRVKEARKRGEAGMTTAERSTAFRARQKAEMDAFEASDLGKMNESLSDYNARVKAAQAEYINRGATGATGASSVTSTDKMATKLGQKRAQRSARASSGRSSLRIGR